MKSVPLWCTQYSNVLIFSRPLPVVCTFNVYPCTHPPVGYTGITRFAGVVPESTRVLPDRVPGYGSPTNGILFSLSQQS